MPNWCHNSLTVTGPDAAIRAFIERVNAHPDAAHDGDVQPLTFEAHAPIPPEDEIDYLAERHDCPVCEGTGVCPGDRNAVLPIIRKDELDSVTETQLMTCLRCQGTGKCVTADGWYHWCIDNWGTKWDAYFDEPTIAIGSEEMDVDISSASHGLVAFPGTCVYQFLTAWSPPEAWLRTVATLEPELTFVLCYAEPGMDFAGEVRYEKGKLIAEKILSVEDVLGPEEMWY